MHNFPKKFDWIQTLDAKVTTLWILLLDYERTLFVPSNDEGLKSLVSTPLWNFGKIQKLKQLLQLQALSVRIQITQYCEYFICTFFFLNGYTIQKLEITFYKLQDYVSHSKLHLWQKFQIVLVIYYTWCNFIFIFYIRKSHQFAFSIKNSEICSTFIENIFSLKWKISTCLYTSYIKNTFTLIEAFDLKVIGKGVLGVKNK